MARHVIILGAGASYTSGYPLSPELGRILSSPEGFEHYLRDQDTDPQLKQNLIAEFSKEVHLFMRTCDSARAPLAAGKARRRMVNKPKKRRLTAARSGDSIRSGSNNRITYDVVDNEAIGQLSDEVLVTCAP